jgi:pimeloyl-ACP methyl ester carboxylesterase
VTEVVLVHGSTQGPSGWDRFAGALRTRGHRVQSVDFATAENTTATLAEAVDQAAGQIGLSDSPVVVAHSAGGLALPALGARLGARHLVWVHAAVAAEHTAFLDEVTADPTAVFNPEWIGQDPTTDPVLAT